MLKRYGVCSGTAWIPWHCNLAGTNNRQITVPRRCPPMSWVTAVWSMNAAACLTLAGFYFAVWCKQRQSPMYLLFSCSAIAAAAISAFELWMLNSRTVDAIRIIGTLDTCAHVGPHAVVCGFRATLSTRRTSLVSLEYLRPADAGADPQFHFSGEYQFHRDH